MRYLFKKHGDSRDTIEAMQQAVRIGIRDLQSIKVARGIPSDERTIFEYIFRHIYYVPDVDGYQTVRTLKRSLKETSGNCVDYSVALATLLTLKGIPCYFKKVSQSGNGFDHVYVLTDNHVLDCVYGQDQSGKEYLKEEHERTPFFNKEISGIKKSRIFNVL